nr:uncharacterized protein K02A2.6-like [Onthophagus taurus]
MEGFRQPKSLSLSGNVSENWRRFKQNFEIFMSATEKNNLQSNVKAAILLNLVGEEAVEIFNGFNLKEDEKIDYKKVMESFERKLSTTCEYDTLNEQMLRDRIVLGIRDVNLQEGLLRMEDLTLQKTIDTCKAAEITKSRVKDLHGKVVEPIEKKKIFKHEKKTSKPISTTNVKLESFGGFRINPMGSVKFNCKTINKLRLLVEFLVVKENVTPILGLSACIDLNLIKRIDLLNVSSEAFVKQNKDVFEGLGTFHDLCKIEIRNDAKPVVNVPRRVPLAIKDRLKQTLIDLEKREIISKVEKPTGWVNNLVIIEIPNKSLRLCLDPKYLNLAIKRISNVLIPTIEDMKSKLSGKSVFSVFDLKDGFWQIKLDRDSSELCTFSTQFVCYRFKRLPFGLNMAPEYFQGLNEKNFGDIQGVLVYFDDILIAGSTHEEHDEIVKKVINRTREKGVKFNKNKIQFRQEQVKYLGHVFFSKDGMKIDEDRIKSIQNLKIPANKKELQSILGMVNFLRPFIPKLSELTNDLRELLKDKVHIVWLDSHTKPLDKIKSKITEAPVLTNFNFNKDITIQADASQSGLGCCLMQEGRPVSFASRSLTNSERNLAQIEKELLSIIFAATRFHNYIYGKTVIVITDHKPLINLLTKKVSDITSSRLKRMKMKLLKYDLNVIFTPGRYTYIADLLSRSYLKENQDCSDNWITEGVHSISTNLNITDLKKREFQIATSNDDILRIIKDYNTNGWPKTKEKVPDNVKHYFNLQNDITCEEGLIFLNYRLIVPCSMRDYILKLLHESHFGIQKTEARAREAVYWPGLMTDIENMLATGKYKKEDEVKVAILLNIIGEEAVHIYNTFNLSDEDRKKYEKVMKAFEDYMNPNKNVIYERFKLFNKKQEEMESFDNFVTKDRIALGVTNKNLQERLRGKEDLTLEKGEMDMSVGQQK